MTVDFSAWKNKENEITYREWTSQPEEGMLGLPPETILNMLTSLPKGMLENDTEVQQKLVSCMLVFASGSLVLNNKELAKQALVVCEHIGSLMPDDSHAQTYASGMIAVLATTIASKEMLLRNQKPDEEVKC